MAKVDKGKKPAPKARPQDDDEDTKPTSKKPAGKGGKEKKEREVIKIRGRAVYPRLNEPDTKFKDEGEYSVKIALDESRAKRLIKDLEQKLADDYDRHCEENKKSKLKYASTRPWTPEVDRETDEETGFTLFKVGAKASGISKKTKKKWTFKLPLVDAKLKPVVKSVWGGSEIIASVEPYTWYTPALGYGISLRLNGVQVIDLVTGKGQNPSDMFDEEEGYEEDEEEETKKASSDDDEDDEDNEDSDGGEEDEDY